MTRQVFVRGVPHDDARPGLIFALRLMMLGEWLKAFFRSHTRANDDRTDKEHVDGFYMLLACNGVVGELAKLLQCGLKSGLVNPDMTDDPDQRELLTRLLDARRDGQDQQMSAILRIRNKLVAHQDEEIAQMFVDERIYERDEWRSLPFLVCGNATTVGDCRFSWTQSAYRLELSRLLMFDDDDSMQGRMVDLGKLGLLACQLVEQLAVVIL